MKLALRLSRTEEELSIWSKAIDKAPPIHWEAMELITPDKQPECLIIALDKPNEIIRAWWGITETVFGEERITWAVNDRSEDPLMKKCKKNKCLVIVNGFYLYPKDKKILVEKPSKKIFMLGGIYYDNKTEQGEINRQFAIDTLPAKGKMREYFDRHGQIPHSYFELKQWQEFLDSGVAGSDIDFRVTVLR